VERFAHWLTAVCFIVLALTGLNLLYGKHVLLPVLGPTVFAALTLAGKYAHNYLAFGFMVGVVMMVVLWVRHNIPNKVDFQWLAKGGGLFVKGVHPPSKKFNAGQKFIFWTVVLGGLSLSLSGISLLFPFTFAMFEPTYSFLNVFGFGLPTDLTPMDEMLHSQLWHTWIALGLIAIVIAHIYIGSLGMEGAFDAVGTGHVDENWAREHHNLWVEEVKSAAPKAQPAE
jgi:formate dehydrogenase subunit gamma